MLLVGAALAVALVAMTVLAGALLHQAAAEAALGDGGIDRLWEAVVAADRVLWLASAALFAALLGAAVAVIRGFLVADLEKLDRALARDESGVIAQDADEVARVQRVLAQLREKLHRLASDKTTGLSAVEDYRTAMARVTEQLTIADRLALTGQLALGVAHEIGGPLSVAQTALDVLPLLGDGDEEERRQTMHDATDAIVRIDTILRDMNRFGLDKTALRTTGGDDPDGVGDGADVAVVVDNVARLGRIHTKVRRSEVQIDGPDNGPDDRGHDDVLAAIPPGRLEQVLLNLIINAADATDGKGPIAVRWKAAGARVHIEVADGGPGIPAEKRAQVFEPFFTTKPAERGSGLGLAVSRRLIERFGGTLSIADDEALGGARMQIELPALADTDDG